MAAAPHPVTGARAEQRDGGQPIHQPAGQQHLQLVELKQHHAVDDLQRQRARQHTTAECDCPFVCGGRQRLMPGRCKRVGFLERHRNRWRDLPTGRAVRADEAFKDAQRIWPEGCRSCGSLSGQASVPGNGHGRHAVSVPWGHWQASHDLVAAES